MSGFLKHIHFLRGLAIILIVGVHARGYKWEWENESHYNFIVSIFDNSTILFVFIAGFLFQHLTHIDFKYPQYLFQKLKYVILPYLFFSIPIIALRILKGSGELPLSDSFNQHPIVYKIIYFLITGIHLVPFWFIPMIAIIYLFSAVLHKLDTSVFYRYVAPCIIIAGLFTFRPENNANPILAFIHFLPFYIAGMLASYFHSYIVKSNRMVMFGLLLTYFTLTMMEVTDYIQLSRKISMEQVLTENTLVFNIYTFKALILSFLLLLVFYKLKDKKLILLSKMADFSFGIFFIHFYFISIFRTIFEPLSFNLVEFIVYFLSVLILSATSIYAIKIVTGKYSRYFTGS